MTHHSLGANNSDRNGLNFLQSLMKITPSAGIFGGVAGVASLPPQVVVRRKRTYQVASNQDQLSLEERLTKRARVVPGAKKRRLR